ncbi:DUF5615 family PIN-like protein [Prosthecomicrobium sp. N25]|uniref:DUF5615 family PIN-like protein n=1 Tax=Prosthecomicrobium sp. N25 TaxID=3129254 RepID=UPI0030775752
MILVTDENIPRQLVEALTEAGEVVIWIRRVCPGISDEAVLDMVAERRAVLVTQDKGFGRRAERGEFPPDCGLVLIRLPIGPDTESCATVARIIATVPDRRGGLIVVDDGGTRRREFGRPR